MKLEIGRKLIISGIDNRFIRWVHANYTIPNPEYITRVKLNKYLGRTTKDLHLFMQHGRYSIEIGYGCLREVYGFLKSKYDMNDIEIVMALNTQMDADWSNTSDYDLRPYQQEAVDYMLKRRFGIIKAPCSSGKTIIGHALAKATGKKTLWLTHTRDLLMQSKKVGEYMLGTKRVGTITDGKVNIGETITYATYQTMVDMPADQRNAFDCVIVDECHRCVTKSSASIMSKIVNSINAEYKYGLSATPETYDGYGKTILMNLGNIEYSIDEQLLRDTEAIMPVDIIPVYTSWKYPEEAYRWNGTLDFQEAVKHMASYPDRCRQVIELLNDRPTMILSNNIDMLCYIMNYLSPEQQKKACLISTKHDESILTAKDVLRNHSVKHRDNYLQMMREGKLQYMFATFQLAKEGLNIPRLEQVIMTFPPVNPNIITQVVGRVARTCPGKTRAVCYDMIDRPTYFRKKWYERVKLYKRLKYEVKDAI